MPLRSDWRLQREGLTGDTLGRLVSKTLLNPALTLPLLLLARYTQRGQQYAVLHENWVRHLRTLLYLGILRKTSALLDKAVENNWTNDVYDWKKELVAVTGGSDGIGAIVVKLLAERGIRVVVLDVQELKYKAPETVRYFHCDLNSPESITAACQTIKSDLGDPTIVINNAGIVRARNVLDSSDTDLRLTFNINSIAHYLLAQQFLPSMIQHNHGMLVTVASQAAYTTAPGMTSYAASKAAALAFHEGLSAELATTYNAPKVRTVVVTQGYTATTLFEGFDKGDGFVVYPLAPETVAEEIVKAVLAGSSRHIMLPRSAWYLAAGMRGWPVWMQHGMRKGLAHLMKGYKGRVVEQPGEGKEKAGVEEEAGEGHSEQLGDSVVEV